MYYISPSFSSFLLPPSSFLLPPSSFLLPFSSFLLPPSSFLPPSFSFLLLPSLLPLPLPSPSSSPSCSSSSSSSYDVYHTSNRFVTSYISPLLSQREIQLVQNSSVKFENMQVKTRPSAREVAAIYTVDEISMEMVVKLAPNHPLGAVAVESGKRVGVNTAQWRSWMLQMTTFLTHQVGGNFRNTGVNSIKKLASVLFCNCWFSPRGHVTTKSPQIADTTCLTPVMDRARLC